MLLEKCALFTPSRTAILHANEGFGARMVPEMERASFDRTRSRGKGVTGHGYRLKSNQLKGERRKDLLAARRFFRNNVHRIKYSWFHERGLPVGSGVVEAACKSVVKARMCRSGMRWTHGGGQTILSLRILIKSNRWEACWSECQAIRLAA